MGALLPFSGGEVPVLKQGKSYLCRRRKISVRTEENFLTYENIFSYVRKFIFLRKKIWPPSNVNFSPSARRKIFVRTEENFLPQENLFPYVRKNIFLRKEIWASSERKFCTVRKERNFRAHENKFPHMRKYFFVYTEINFLIYRNFTPCKPAGNAGREKGGIRAPSEGLRRGKREAFVGGEICLPSRSIPMDCQLNERKFPCQR